MRELSLKALMNMEGQRVLVKDLEYDAYDQICEVKVNKKLIENKLKKKNRFQLVVTELWLENEEFIFTFNGLKCGNGEFKVYSIGD